MSIDELINLSDLIVIGNFVSVHPSRWNTSNGVLPNNATIETVSQNKWSIFTDFEFKISQYIKGETTAPVIRIRTFQGEVGIDKMTTSNEPNYQLQGVYLLFLFIDDGPTSLASPNAYYGTSSPYQIFDNTAKSKKDEWLLEDLIAYIQKVLSETISTPTELISEQTPSATTTPEITISETETLIPTEKIVESLTPSLDKITQDASTPVPSETITPTP